MEIDIFLTHQEITLEAVEGKTCVVIDTLRATSTIITALSHGCSEIIPVNSVVEALSLKKRKAYQDYLLGGEVEGHHIANFHLGNSPLEYTNGILLDKGLILTTTNGTKTLQKVRGADTVIICALLNARAVVDWLAQQKKDIVICCSGTRGHYSLEDFLTAGRLIKSLKEKKELFFLSDLAYTAATFYEKIKKNAAGNNSLIETLKNSTNGKRLLENGFEKDIEHCAREDIFPVLPLFKKGSIKQLENPSLKDSMPRISII